jgi:nicotinate phosphoribosyltransferase
MRESIYRPSMAILTDLYELTMASAYYATDRHHEEAIFHLFFRQPPFGSGFTLAAGLEAAVEFLRTFKYGEEDLAYLGTVCGVDGQPLFEPAFLEYLAGLPPGLGLDVDAVPEGTVVFPYEPLLRVRGPILAAQLVETALLNLVNFPTLVATNAARVVLAAGGDPVLEFGLRRAQGPDGGLTASRAAYIGGCEATSNVLAGRLYGIPVRGTHAHSWILSWLDEQEAMDKWAEVQPHNTILLVDTYDTLEGVRRAIETGRRMRAAGRELGGIRLDSGDLAYLSHEARRMLDEAGFPDARIVASNDLDAETIASLREQGAAIDTWGVGTRLVTAYDQPALGGVYKLTAARSGPDARWRPTVKVSADPGKTTVPGMLGVRRFFDGQGVAAADMIYDTLEHQAPGAVLVDPTNALRRKPLDPEWRSEDLLVPVMRDGDLVAELPGLDAVREHARQSLASFHPSILRRLNPHRYPAGLELELHLRREELVAAASDGSQATQG